MNYCSKCSVELKQDMKYCPSCGEKIALYKDEKIKNKEINDNSKDIILIVAISVAFIILKVFFEFLI